jgi:hypothetical protein
MEQVICRLTYEEKQAFQMKCLQENVKMQTVLKGAVQEFIKKSAPDGQLDRKPVEQAKDRVEIAMGD